MAAADAITVEKLYELCEVLDAAKDTISEKKEEYGKILSGSKGGANEKRLAAQLIVRYAQSFPEMRDRSLDALFELCEDEEVNIRKFAIKELPSLCKEPGDHVSKVADVLTQLLQSDDTQEQLIVQNALMIILNKYTKDTLGTIFGHVLNAEEELIRERAVRFLALKLKSLPETILTPEIQTYVFDQSKKILQDVTGDEFILFMHILSNLPQLQSVTGRRQLLDLITEQADLDKPFDPSDSDRVDQICQCVKQAIHFFSKNVPSTKFTTFMLAKVLPVLEKIQATEGNENPRLDCVRVLAEIAVNCGELESPETHLDTVFTNLMTYLPQPPSESGEGAVVPENVENGDEPPKIQFSEVESLMWTLHQLSKRHPQFLTDESRGERVKEFRKRLQYLARVIQVYSKKLRTLLGGMAKTDLQKDENKVKVIALRTTSNINALVRDFLHTSPTYKASILPSWKTPEKSASATNGASARGSSGDKNSGEPPSKRGTSNKTPISYYAPPSGKFSERAGTYADNDERGYRRGGRGRGGYRGRGGWGNRGGRWY